MRSFSKSRKLNIVMDWLDIGGNIKLEGVIYCLSEEDRLIIKMKKFRSDQNHMNWDEGENFYLSAEDVSFNYFYNKVAELPDEFFTDLLMNKVLNDINRKNRG